MVAAAGATATITGIVTDGSGKPIENARIDHTDKRAVEILTDARGRFRVVTDVPAIVVRGPGYVSQRVRIAGDAQVQIALRRIQSKSRCKLSATPAFKTKQANDIDYVATWFYIGTKEGPKGIISGGGPNYSHGAPDNGQVWSSDEYAEYMDESGLIDAAGHSSEGYWRLRTVFGAAAQYYRQDRETAEQLDCVMDHVPIKLW